MLRETYFYRPKGVPPKLNEVGTVWEWKAYPANIEMIKVK